jgi:hypothetical protein
MGFDPIYSWTLRRLYLISEASNSHAALASNEEESVMKLKLPFLVLLTACLGQDPALVAKPVSEANTTPLTCSNSSVASWHTIKAVPPSDAPKIRFYNKINPVWWLKNRDDPRPPEWYKPGDRFRNLKWSFRNPMHNFNFYVIGVADKKFARSGQFPERNSDPRGGWDFEAVRYKFIYLPFISYHRPKLDFYFGWRERGNFGIKFNVNPAKKTEFAHGAASRAGGPHS